MAKKRFKNSLEILDKLVSCKTISKDSNLELIEFVEEYFKSVLDGAANGDSNR